MWSWNMREDVISNSQSFLWLCAGRLLSIIRKCVHVVQGYFYNKAYEMMLPVWSEQRCQICVKWEFIINTIHLFHLAFSAYSMCTYSVSDLIFFLPVHRFGSVFLWDSGSSVGSIDGHNKSINAVDYKPTRPFRICTASEDKEVGFFEGPPFKFHHFSKVGSK